MKDFLKDVITATMPKGAVWTPVIQGDFDKFLDGQADSHVDIYEFLSLLSKIRDPQNTPFLKDLEKEYGITGNESLTEQQRRDYLESIISRSQENGTPEELQRRLQEAGFDVQVHANDPANDPQVILDQVFRMVAGGSTAYAGNEQAIASRVGGELIVNGDKFRQVPNYIVQAGNSFAFAGHQDFLAGRFDGLSRKKIVYQVPTDPADWPLLFFIGGDATKDIDGKIIKVDVIEQPIELRSEFLKIVLKYKPLHTWAISVVDFT